MNLGIDVQSGERSYKEYIKTILSISQNLKNICIHIIGDSDKICEDFPGIYNKSTIKLIDAKQTITMEDEPIRAIHKKKKSSIVIGIRSLKEKKIDIFFSPGNTGAIVGAAVLNLGMIDHIKRPSMATFFPRIGGGETLILDIGANPEANEINYYHNAILGYSYYSIINNKKEPTIGLLNIGGESVKGTAILKKAHKLLTYLPTFIGNVEGYNVFNGSVDIVVCNGFTGNSILKIAEAMKKFFIAALRDVFSKNTTNSYMKKMAMYFISSMGIYTEKKKRLTEKIMPRFYGAAPLLGIKGSVLVGHGACTGNDLINAVKLAKHLFDIKYLNNFELLVKKFNKK